MKKIFLFLSACILTSLSFAQAPQGINYQGVARDNYGAAVSNKNIGVQFKILQGSTPVYVESHTATTDTFGLYSLVIGKGSASLGSFSAISWGSGPMSIAVYIDPNGGTSYILVSTSALQSVPYALFSGSSSNGITAVVGPGAVTATTNSGTVTVGLGPVGSPVNTYGSSTAFPIIQVDADGRVTGATTQTFTSSGGTMTSLIVGPGLTSTPTGTITTAGGIDLPPMSSLSGGTLAGSATSVPVITYDSYGRLVSVTNTPIIGLLPPGGVSGQVLGNSGGVPTWTTPAIPTATVNAAGMIQGDGTIGNPITFAPLSTGHIYVGDATSAATAVVMGGDITMTSVGATTVNQLQGTGLSINTPTAGQVLRYNGTNWVNATHPSLPGVSPGSILFSDPGNAGIWSPTNLSNISSDGNSITVVNTNTVGTAATFSAVANSGNPVLQVSANTSTGYAIRADNTTGAAIVANSGGPYAINGNLSSGGGNAVEGDLVNNANGNAVAAYIDATSTGSAGYFENTNLSNSGPALKVISNSTVTTAYSAQFSGAAGVMADKITTTDLTIGNNLHVSLNANFGQVLTSDGTGNATWQPPQGVTSMTGTGPITVTVSGNTATLGMANSGVSSGTYGNASTIPSITVDAFGRITNVNPFPVSGLLPSPAFGQVLFSNGSSWLGSNTNNLTFDGTNMGIGLASGFNGLFHVKQVGSGTNAAYFEINNASNGNAAVNATTNSTNGNAGYFSNTNSSNTASALYVSHVGNGNSFLAANSGGGIAVNASAASGNAISATNSGGSTIYANNSGTAGDCGNFNLSNSANNNHAVDASTPGNGNAVNAISSGSGYAISGNNTGTGIAGGFFNNNANTTILAQNNGTGAVVQAIQAGTAGPVGVFNITGAGNNSDALKANTGGTGNAIVGVNTGNGSGGLFAINNPGSPAPALIVNTTGGGNSAKFSGGAGVKVDGFATAVTIVPNGGVVLGGGDYFVLIPAGTTGNITFPAANAANTGKVYVIKNVGTGAYNLQAGSTYVSTTGTAGQNNIPANSIVRIICDGSAWQAW